jgi:hypothetical protein
MCRRTLDLPPLPPNLGLLNLSTMFSAIGMNTAFAFALALVLSHPLVPPAPAYNCPVLIGGIHLFTLISITLLVVEITNSDSTIWISLLLMTGAR